MTELTVVLISKNQEWNIARLVESVLRETETIPEREIIHVDSASTDRTTDIAAKYPITILKLYADQRLTAAAGRFVGYKQSKGDFVLFLDGDMELYEGWLEQALDFMRNNPDIGAISGNVIDRPKEFQPPSAGEFTNSPANPGNIIDVPHGGGAAMYRRSVLQQVGTFNPYLYSDEEPELCLRIRHAGYRIVRLPYPIVFHYSPPAEAVSTLLGRRSRKLWLGYGQNIRYLLKSPLLLPYLKERGWAIPPALVVSLGFLALLTSVLSGQWGWLMVWVAGVTALIVVIAIRKRSVKGALLTILKRLLCLDGTVRGLFFPPYDPAGYPGRYDVIQEIHN